MNEISRVKNEEGSVLIVALIVLVLLTLLGIFATRTTEVEMQIAGNDYRYKRNVYFAEAMAMACAQDIKNEPVLDIVALSWLHGMESELGQDPNKVLDNDFWNGNFKTPNVAEPEYQYMAAVEGVAEQTSLDMTKSRIHMYAIYGRRYDDSKEHEGRSIVNIGYKKAF
jgi:type IV pilus assembly protein PilX